MDAQIRETAQGNSSHWRISAPIERIAVAAAMTAGLYHLLVFGWKGPFWLDEAYTGTIASQATLDGFIRWCRHELSGPIYYGVLWLWEKLVGNGDTALRLPSLFLWIGAVLLMALHKGQNLRNRLLWAGLAAVWLPGLPFAAQARPQALLFLLGTAQAIAFLRCMDGLSGRWLAGWSLFTMLLLMTHIDSAPIGGFQFLFLIATYRARLLEFWPALAVFLVAAAWLPFQVRIFSAFLKPGVASYAVLEPNYLWYLQFDLLGNGWSTLTIMIVVLAILGAQFARRAWAGTPLPYTRSEAGLALSGLLAVAAIVAFGFVKSSYFPRYLIPFMPSLLFGLSLVLRRTPILGGLLPSACLIVWTCNTMHQALTRSDAQEQYALNPFEFEQGSIWLMDRNARHVLFLWDNPSSGLNDSALQSEMAGFFFRRAAYAADVRAIAFDSRKQGMADLVALTARDTDAILWIDSALHPGLLQTMRGFDCHRFGGRRSRSAACIRNAGHEWAVPHRKLPSI